MADESENGSTAGRGAGGFGTLGERIRARRRALGITLDLLAERAGCAKSYLSAVENGHKGPPGEDLLRRIEGALGLEADELVRAARWAHTPGPVKRDLARLSAERRSLAGSVEQLRGMIRELAQRGGLDEAFRSGELARLIGSETSEGAALVDLPVEVPLINRVSAGYPTEFTDLG